MPSATFLLKFINEQRDYLGGWNAQASDRSARTSRSMILTRQRAVIKAIFSQNLDPLEESEMAGHFGSFLTTSKVPLDARRKCIEVLTTKNLYTARTLPPVPPADPLPEAGSIPAHIDASNKKSRSSPSSEAAKNG